MSSYKEIVTKAIIGKAKKTINNKYELVPTEKVDTVLGCWVINHHFDGYNNDNKVNINGSFDVNVWYSYNGNSKTMVDTKTYNYSDIININLKDNDNENEVIVKSLKQPQVLDVNIEDNKISMNITKELGVEVIGDTTIKVPVENTTDDYEDLTNNDIDNLNDNYLDKGVNQN